MPRRPGPSSVFDNPAPVVTKDEPAPNGNTIPSVNPTGTGKSEHTPPKNNTAAGAAADALVMLNSLGAFGARMVKYDLTADAIDVAQDEFRERVYQALLLDPKLAEAIIRGGGNSAKVALIIAYAMMLTVVAPVATLEYKAKAEEKKAELEKEAQAQRHPAGYTRL